MDLQAISDTNVFSGMTVAPSQLAPVRTRDLESGIDAVEQEGTVGLRHRGWSERINDTMAPPYLPGNAIRLGLQRAGLIQQPARVGSVEGCGIGCGLGAAVGAVLGFAALVPMVVIGVLKVINKKSGVNHDGRQNLGEGIPLIVVGAFMPGLAALALGTLCGCCGTCVPK